MALPQQQLLALYKVALDIVGAAYHGAVRDILLATIDDAVLVGLPKAPTPKDHLFSDFNALNRHVPQPGEDPLLETWIRNCLARYAPHARIGELRAMLVWFQPTAAAPPAPPPFESHQDRFGGPLLNRRVLRSCLEKLVANGGRRAISIRGEPMTGKSHSEEFARLIADSLQLQVLKLDVREDQLPSYAPDDLAKGICTPLRIDPAGMPREEDYASPDRWVTELRGWLIDRLGGWKDTLWIVLDHFEDETVHELTRRLIEQLAVRSVNSEFPPLLLLGFEPLGEPEVLHRNVAREVIGEIRTDDIEAYYRKRFPDASDRVIELATNLVTDGLGQEWTVEEVVEEIERVAAKLKENGQSG